MGRFLLIDVAAAAVALFLWYGWFVSYNRRRGAALLHWVQAACLGKGRVLNPRWRAGSSQLKATLRLSSRWFEDARLIVHLQPRPFPVQWFLSRWRKHGETLTFEADMGFPPGFHLDVIRRRWSGHSVKKAASETRTWTLSRPGPVVLTTKDEWPPELTPVINALTAWRDKDFLNVRFKPTSPRTFRRQSRSKISPMRARLRRYWDCSRAGDEFVGKTALKSSHWSFVVSLGAYRYRRTTLYSGSATKR